MTASLVAGSDGSISAIGGGPGDASALGDWRGSIPPGTGYWADVEFGTQGTKVAYCDDLVRLEFGPQGMNAVGATKTGGITPRLYLTQAAQQLTAQLTAGALTAAFHEGFRALMSSFG
jgi:hypothetical protein